MNSIFVYTGNPFVDAGISALTVWCEKKNPLDLDDSDVKEAMKDVANIFCQPAWIKNFYTTFSNGVLVQPAYKGKEREKWLEFMSEFFNALSPLRNSGSCISCGIRDALSIKKEKRGLLRSEVPLTGGSLNYYSYAKNGADYCAVCAIAIQVSPLVYYRTAGKMILVHSSSEKVMRTWAKRCIKDVLKQKATNNFTGCFTENYWNPQNALFHIAQSLVETDEEEWLAEPIAIRIYHFTNYGQGAELGYYDLPSKVFRFLAIIQQHEEKNSWNEIVLKNYWVKKKETLNSEKNEEEFKNNKNYVYSDLLDNKSLVRYFFIQKERRTISTWNLLSLYLKEVRQMQKERIDAIKKVADEIASFIKSSGNEKRMIGIENAKYYDHFRNVLRMITKERIKSGAEEPLFTFDDYVERLFPEGNMGWNETRDLILFRLYEILHVWLIDKDLPIVDDDALVSTEN